MDKSTHEIRLAKWTNILTQCQNRPEGQTIRSWCEQNHISPKQYYYWQRRVRKAVYSQMNLPAPSGGGNQPLGFAEISPGINSVPGQQENLLSGFAPEILIRKGGYLIGIQNGISDRLLDRILKEVSHAG